MNQPLDFFSQPIAVGDRVVVAESVNHTAILIEAEVTLLRFDNHPVPVGKRDDRWTIFMSIIRRGTPWLGSTSPGRRAITSRKYPERMVKLSV